MPTRLYTHLCSKRWHALKNTLTETNFGTRNEALLDSGEHLKQHMSATMHASDKHASTDRQSSTSLLRLSSQTSISMFTTAMQRWSKKYMIPHLVTMGDGFVIKLCTKIHFSIPNIGWTKINLSEPLGRNPGNWRPLIEEDKLSITDIKHVCIHKW